jgi:DnaJ homolog subfamily A member 5
MEEDNKKARKAARREFNDTVRELVRFVRKRDKRVVAFQVPSAVKSVHDMWELCCLGHCVRD